MYLLYSNSTTIDYFSTVTQLAKCTWWGLFSFPLSGKKKINMHSINICVVNICVEFFVEHESFFPRAWDTISGINSTSGIVKRVSSFFPLGKRP